MRLVLLLPLLAALFVLPSGTHGMDLHDRGVSVASTAQGLRMTLSLPRSSYPRDALVRATLRFQNMSSHTLYLDVSAGGDRVSVLNDRGHRVYSAFLPLGADTLLVDHGPFRWWTLRTGQRITDHVYLVLRGTHIVTEAFLSRSLSGQWSIIHGPEARIHLTAETTPTVTVATSPGLRITVTPPWSISGKLHYYWQSSCMTPRETANTGKGWTSTVSSTITPYFAAEPTLQLTCSGSVVWNGLAGWLNHPVATFRYRSP